MQSVLTLKLGIKENTTENNLYWICILKFRKIQKVTYIYKQNEFLTKISPNPIKTALFSHWQMAYNSDRTAAWTSIDSPLCPSAQL